MQRNATQRNTCKSEKGSATLHSATMKQRQYAHRKNKQLKKRSAKQRSVPPQRQRRRDLDNTPHHTVPDLRNPFRTKHPEAAPAPLRTAFLNPHPDTLRLNTAEVESLASVSDTTAVGDAVVWTCVNGLVVGAVLVWGVWWCGGVVI
jgi:hypothetical protein